MSLRNRRLALRSAAAALIAIVFGIVLFGPAARVRAAEDVRALWVVRTTLTSPRLDLEVPRTSQDLKRVKKIAREKSVEEIEKLFIQETLKRNASNVTRSAEETGMQRANFQALMKKYDIRIRGTEQGTDESGAS